ncbi:MAG TPA: arginase family protein [Gaiellaceae bacterium]
MALEGGEYECHSCGRTFRAGLVRVPRAWGSDGEPMAEAAFLELPYPEAGVVDEETLTEQSLALACSLPERPLIVGGCCCAHVGAVEALATRCDRLGIVWLDAHGDLNTPESSPSGNLWGMPLRMLIDSDTVQAEDVALVGARSLDPPEERFIADSGLRLGEERVAEALDGVDAVYVAFDCDVLEPDCGVAMFMPEPGGMTPEAAEAVLVEATHRTPVAGLGFSGFVADPANVAGLVRFCAAVGL